MQDLNEIIKNWFTIQLLMNKLDLIRIIKLLNSSPERSRMYNRFTHEKEQQKLNSYLRRSLSHERIEASRKRSNEKMSDKYKQRVRDFLVKITSKPIILGQYQPPITHIVRNPENEKILANAQLYINGFKTNKQRIASKIEQNQILDLSPTSHTALLHEYRPRDTGSQIQPGMRFAGRSASQVKLPSINDGKTLRMRFKALEEMVNNLKTLKPSTNDEIGLVNRLQTVSGGKELDHLTFSMMALRQSKLLKTKYHLTK